MIYSIVCNRFVLGILGVLLLFGGGYWTGRNNRPVQSPPAAPTSTQETVTREQVVVVVQRPGGATTTTTTNRTTNSKVQTVQPATSSRPKYSVSAQALYSDLLKGNKYYYFDVARRISDTPIWLVGSYSHRARPEVGLGLRIEW